MLELKLLLLSLLGVFVGGQVNRGIYRLAWHQRLIGAWSPADPAAPPRQWYDRLPVVGWWTLRRESALHGSWFWVRPCLIEVALGIGFPLLYWYEVQTHGLGFVVKPAILQQQYFAHLLLFSLMMVATFIDFDEQTIPDAIVVPGACLGLLAAALFPQTRLLTADAPPVFLHAASGTVLAGQVAWPAWLDTWRGVAIGLFCFLGWWVAILPWTWTLRRGLGRAVVYFLASLRRRTTWWLGLMPCVGLPILVGTWIYGGANWESLLSALIGMAFGGGLVWAFRIVGSQALGQEAMGFGDVTLMAMIGSFVGWQASLVIFFLAPAAGVFIAVTQWLLTGRKDIAFGPYLCMGALFLILNWGWIWTRHAQQLFGLGSLLPAMLVIGIAMSWALLTLSRAVRGG